MHCSKEAVKKIIKATLLLICHDCKYVFIYTLVTLTRLDLREVGQIHVVAPERDAKE